MNKFREFFHWNVVARIQIWWRLVALVLGVLVALGTVIFGVYELTIASPVTKLSIAVASYPLTFLFSITINRLYKGGGRKKGVAVILYIILMAVAPIFLYTEVLVIFVTPSFVAAVILLSLGFSVMKEILDGKKVQLHGTTGKAFDWIRSIIAVASFAGQIYCLARYLGYF